MECHSEIGSNLFDASETEPNTLNTAEAFFSVGEQSMAVFSSEAVLAIQSGCRLECSFGDSVDNSRGQKIKI